MNGDAFEGDDGPLFETAANDTRPPLTDQEREELVRQYFRFAAWACPNGVPPGWEEDVARGEAPTP